jgi:putative ABC transport system ATP-binding protein
MEMADVILSSRYQRESSGIEAIQWRIMPGDYWVIGGLHGSGKSDLLTTAAGLQQPSRGKVLLWGRDLSEFKEDELLRERLRIGFVFEKGGRILPHLTVTENIALPLRYHKNWRPREAEEQVAKTIEFTGLTAYAHNTARMMSEDWQQRVGLARALALNPEVLFLDKPLNGLESRHRRWWLDFLGKLSEGSPETNVRPITLVVTADDLQPWMDRARQFAVLNKNRWLLLGGQADLKQTHEPLLRELWADDFILS